MVACDVVGSCSTTDGSFIRNAAPIDVGHDAQQRFDSIAVRTRSPGSALSVRAISRVPKAANVSCPRGRTFVSSGVHPMRHGLANRMDYELLAWCGLARELHGQRVRKRWV